jgi:hypothetical protein
MAQAWSDATGRSGCLIVGGDDFGKQMLAMGDSGGAKFTGENHSRLVTLGLVRFICTHEHLPIPATIPRVWTVCGLAVVGFSGLFTNAV